MAAISQARKQRPSLEVVVLEMGNWTSYAACGIPFVVGGEIAGIDKLIARSAEQHRATGTDVRLHHEVTAIDLASGHVEVHDHDGATTYELGYDELLIATGGRPVRPPLPGIDLPFVHGVQTLDDGAYLLDYVERVGCSRIVVIGAGYIGLEMAEAFCHRGCSAVVIDQAQQPMVTMDPDMGALVADAIRARGMDLRLGVGVEGFEPGVVLTTDGPVPADLVVLGIGVVPRSELAGVAGLELGVKGGIVVDDHQRTSQPGVWAAGDCCTSTHLVTGQQVHMALGTYANRQARVAGINIGGGDARFPGVMGTAVTRLCDLEIGRTGLSTAEALAAGFDFDETAVRSTTRAHYYPGAESMSVKVLFERTSGRVLGGQVVGGQGSAKRIDVISTAMSGGLTIDDVLELDLGYAPPFGGVWDPWAIAARNAVSGRPTSGGASR
jgi:NADPH-dependent 2,4-dienoyl-CoA reductase/sulfur reductase-like enzyme